VEFPLRPLRHQNTSSCPKIGSGPGRVQIHDPQDGNRQGSDASACRSWTPDRGKDS
jgi:hypothetical protein